jgi:hypothetical protein
MAKKNELQVAVEGFTLIGIGFFAILFHVMKFVPEADTVLTSNLTLFDFLQLGLKMLEILLLWCYYSSITRQISQVYMHFLAAYPETKSDLKFMLSALHFFTLIFIYELAVPEMKFLLLKANQQIYPVVGVVEALFVIIGMALLIHVWNALQDYIGDITAEKKAAPAPEEEKSESKTN